MTHLQTSVTHLAALQHNVNELINRNSDFVQVTLEVHEGTNAHDELFHLVAMHSDAVTVVPLHRYASWVERGCDRQLEQTVRTSDWLQYRLCLEVFSQCIMRADQIYS